VSLPVKAKKSEKTNLELWMDIWNLKKCQIIRKFWTNWGENPFMCSIFICLIIVVLPDSPAPKSRIFTTLLYFCIHSSSFFSSSLEVRLSMSFGLKQPNANCAGKDPKKQITYKSPIHLEYAWQLKPKSLF